MELLHKLHTHTMKNQLSISAPLPWVWLKQKASAQTQYISLFLAKKVAHHVEPVLYKQDVCGFNIS